MMRQCLGGPNGIGRGHLIPGGSRCAEHQRAMYRFRQRTRDPGPVRLYGTRRWKNLAAAVIAEAVACHWCGTPKAITKLTADHVCPVRTHPSLALDPANVVAACRSCQNRRIWQPDTAQWPGWARTPRHRP